MKKFFSLVAALLAVSLISFGFVSCKDNDDDDDGPSVIATFSATDALAAAVGTDVSYTIIAYSNKAWKQTLTTEGVTMNQYTGTYEVKSGDWKNGTVVLTIKKQLSSSAMTDYDGDPQTITITDSSFTFAGNSYTKK